MFSLTVPIILTIVNIRGLIACRSVISYWPEYDTNYPSLALNYCNDKMINGTPNSWLYTCENTTNTLYAVDFGENLDCQGDWTLFNISYSKSDSIVSVVCDNSFCDFVYLELVEATDECKPIYNGDWVATTYVVNYCVEMGITPGSGNTKYFSLTCNGTTLLQNQHYNSDCSDSPVVVTPTYTSGNCYYINDQWSMVNILNCSAPMVYKLETWEWFSDIYDALFRTTLLCFYLFVIVKLFKHLYKCKSIHVGNILKPVCCIIVFSSKHNWIFEPSKRNKIYAILTTIFKAVALIVQIIPRINNIIIKSLDVYSDQWMDVFLTANTMSRIGDIFNVLFFTSTLEYYMNASGLIKQMISTKFLCFIKFIAIFNEFQLGCLDIIWSYYGYPTYYAVYMYIPDIIRIFVAFCLLLLYYRGMNNVCHYWYSKQWIEYEKYGETERTHEIFKDITRVSVVVTSAMIFKMSTLILSFINQASYGSIYTTMNLNYETEKIVTVYNSLMAIVIVILMIPYICLIYFMYPFGHIHYEKICCKCDKAMYKYLTKRHQNQVKNGGFDGLQYQSYKKNKYSCLCCCKNNTNNMMMNLNNNNAEDADL